MRCNKLELTTFPYEDKTLLFDEVERLYYLTPTFLEERAFDPSSHWGTDEEIKKQSIRVARNFKDYLINTSALSSDLRKDKAEILEYIYAKDHNIRRNYALGLLRFCILDAQTDGGTSNEYFGDINITQNNITNFLVSNDLIRRGTLRYRVESTDADFKIGVDPNVT